MITWKKNDLSESRSLSEHFAKFEFECQCKYKDCMQQSVNEELIAKLELVRTEFGAPLSISSGFRCAKHQRDLAETMETAVGLSQHELGNAADIATNPAKSILLLPIIRKHFMAVGVANSFIHVDLRTGKRRDWRYSK
ncbi:D-Ala-D-Ala carboxypeptidase family metallohydrolase [Candidatus Dojkabacteria bacterium]|jgi:uncharacterized protein YcbK (DUF882 family)|nr:D-Ala-D-Ala carboxypeptidase family metallohydrolase [Candidatus Dojkabacteria bacterium]